VVILKPALAVVARTAFLRLAWPGFNPSLCDHHGQTMVLNSIKSSHLSMDTYPLSNPVSSRMPTKYRLSTKTIDLAQTSSPTS